MLIKFLSLKSKFSVYTLLGLYLMILYFVELDSSILFILAVNLLHIPYFFENYGEYKKNKKISFKLIEGYIVLVSLIVALIFPGFK